MTTPEGFHHAGQSPSQMHQDSPRLELRKNLLKQRHLGQLQLRIGHWIDDDLDFLDQPPPWRRF